MSSFEETMMVPSYLCYIPGVKVIGVFVPKRFFCKFLYHIVQSVAAILVTNICLNMIVIYMYIAQGQDRTTSIGSKLLCRYKIILYLHLMFVYLVIYCKFLPFNDFLTVFPI